ncbi:hypothetical protein SteCoe_17238 [Stentor coeruleus]|uniref:Uncharacterized protein n=1 Tax=Stentor coeruleus TaxID=5963 RepID=A0A1R2BZJ3_9CILI|nr:hypothetical protein SteCoe_17238 [Stentor coeruleus]
MNESYISSPLMRSKMLLQSTQKSPEDLAFEEQHDLYQEEISKTRTFLQQNNSQHDIRLKEVRISYEMKLQQLKKNSEEEAKVLQDHLWELKHSLDQEKQIHLTRTHRFAIEKLEGQEKIEDLQLCLRRLQKELNDVETQHEKLHGERVSRLKKEYEEASYTIRTEKRRAEEVIAEESYAVKDKFDKREAKIQELEKNRDEQLQKLRELEDFNQEKMQEIEKSLRNSQKAIENHEEKMNTVLSSSADSRIQGLNDSIKAKEQAIEKGKERNEKLLDTLEKLEKILYGKSYK